MVMKEKNETKKEWRSDKGSRERKRKGKVEKERERGKSMKVEIQTLDIAPKAPFVSTEIDFQKSISGK